MLDGLSGYFFRFERLGWKVYRLISIPELQFHQNRSRLQHWQCFFWLAEFITLITFKPFITYFSFQPKIHKNNFEPSCWCDLFLLFLSIWPRDHLAWPIGFVSLSKAEISFVKVLLRSNSDKSSRVKFNSYEQQPPQQSNPKLSGPLCGKLQYISESRGPSPFSFDLNPLEGDWCTI